MSILCVGLNKLSQMKLQKGLSLAHQGFVKFLFGNNETDALILALEKEKEIRAVILADEMSEAVRNPANPSRANADLLQRLQKALLPNGVRFLTIAKDPELRQELVDGGCEELGSDQTLEAWVEENVLIPAIP